MDLPNNLTKIAEPNVYQVIIKGGESPNVALELYEYFQQLPKVSEIRLLTVMTDFEGFKEIKEFLQGINADELKITRLVKNAILSESRWVERIVKMEDQLISKTNIRFFKENQESEAIDWLKMDK